MNTGNATGKGNLKPTKTPALHINMIIGREKIYLDGQKRSYNESNHNVHKTEGKL